MKPTPVLAESYNAFKRFVLDNNLNVGHFAYIGGLASERIRGYKGVILAVERWWRNPSYDSNFYDVIRFYAHAGNISVIKGVVSSREEDMFHAFL